MSLNNDMRQNIQSNLDFSSSSMGEAQTAGREGSESLRTTSVPESPAGTFRTMEEIVERENLKEALRRVKANKGGPGVDGITFGQLDDHLKQHWPAIREQLLSGTYRPQPVKRVEIPKPDGGVRKLGIPTRDTGLHAFRHGLATQLVEASVPLSVLQKQLRHADVSTTLRIYTHAIPQSQRDAMEGVTLQSVRPTNAVLKFGAK